MFSGGKDSSLSALFLEPFFDVELVTCTFSLAPVAKIAAEVAGKLGFKHIAIEMDVGVLDEALQMVLEDGYPRNAINHIHLRALEKVASLAGHESLDTTKIYCTPSLYDLSQAVEKIGEEE